MLPPAAGHQVIGADVLPAHNLGQPPVHHQYFTEITGHDIVRLQVTVEHAA